MEAGGAEAALLVFCTAVAFMTTAMVVAVTAIRVVPEYQRLVVFRLGRLLRAVGPGIVILFPFVDTAVKADLREQERQVTATATTNDLVRVSVEFGWGYKIVDPIQMVTQVPGEVDAHLQQLVQDTLRTLVGELAFDELRTERRRAAETLAQRLDEIAGRSGLRITQAKIHEIARA